MILTDDMIATLPCRYGSLTFFTEDEVISRSLRKYGEWAQSEIDFLLQFVQPGDTVIDVGAFIGTHTLAFAQRVKSSGRVLAFEARALFHEVLKKNTEQNDCRNVTLFNMALTDHVDNITVCPVGARQPTNFGGASLLQSLPGSLDRDFEVISAVPLDQFLIRNCALIKIDAEGMESEVLRGARDTIRAAHPIVFAECNSLEHGLPVMEYAREEGYVSFVMSTRAYNPSNYRLTSNNIFGEAREVAFLLVPRDRTAIVESLSNQDSGPVLVTPILTADDLVLALLKKPQYKNEVLSHTQAALLLGTDFWANESEVKEFRDTINDQQRRLSKSRITQGSTTEFKIYPAGSNGYSESTSRSIMVSIGEWIPIELDLPDGLGTGDLRIDPANCPCIIEFKSIQLEDRAGEIPWTANDAASFRTLKVAGSAVATTTLPFTALSYGEDPYILLHHNLPRDLPMKIKTHVKIDTSIDRYTREVQRAQEALTAIIAKETRRIGELNDALSAAGRQLEDVRAEMVTSQSAAECRLREMRAELIVSQSERALLLAEVSRLAGEKSRSQRERDEANVLRSKLQDEADLLRSKLQQEITALKAELDQEHAIRLGMEFSKSWRVTSPLRTFMLRLRNLRGRERL